MRDTLSAFADHCDRVGLARRPTVFVRFLDIWGTPVGEIGFPDPGSITNTVFALLCPWAMVPTVGQAWLVVDMVDKISVTCLKVNLRGIFEPHWLVPYGMSDSGTLEFGEPESTVIPNEIGLGIIAAKKERTQQRYWEFNHSIDSVLPVVEELLNQ